MNAKNKPAGLEVRQSDRELYIKWGDGHESVYPFFGLRKNCPCVECRGGHGSMGRYDKSLFKVEGTRKFDIEDIRQVGNHAIRIFWSDGHSNGMYQWETLRKLCPCDACYEAEAEEES